MNVRGALGLACLVLACSNSQGANSPEPQASGRAAPPASAGAAGLPLHQIKLPPGFRIAVFAQVKDARSMVLSPTGTLFVGSRGTAGLVHAVLDRDNNGAADEVIQIARGLNFPNGVAVRDGALYVAEINRILRYDGIEGTLKKPPRPVVVSDSYPKDEHHGQKFIAFGPDGKLYVPVGAPCNICRREEPYASITRINADGSGREIFARGVRNTVGFDWHPRTRELWFTDNGRDMLGDDIPPDELNHAPEAGAHFGYPFCHADDITDPEFGAEKPCSDTRPPTQKLGPHVAALGMRFYTGSMFPAEYRDQIFIAEHGSWNRSKKIGYRLSLVRLDGSHVKSYETFADGWLQGQEEWGRPVDVLVMPDGALLVSDDKASVIYRITYEPGR
jgi:glucose/arabinose dehydrogenase